MFIKNFSTDIHTVAHDFDWHVTGQEVSDAAAPDRVRVHRLWTFCVGVVVAIRALLIEVTGGSEFIDDSTDRTPTESALISSQ